MARKRTDQKTLDGGTVVSEYDDGSVFVQLPNGQPYVIEQAWLTGRANASVRISPKVEREEPED